MSTATLTAPVTSVTTAKSPAPAGGQRLVFIDALRGLAALGVATYHIHRYGPLHEAADSLTPRGLAFLFEHGWMGVQIFFVISGFVITYSVRDALITPAYLGNFALRRSIRLDPPYWTTIACVLLLYFLGGPLDAIDPLTDPPNWGKLAAHGFYLQDILGYGNVSVGFWSLCIEVQFYLSLIVMLGVSQWLVARLGKTASMDAACLLATLAPPALVSLVIYEPGGDYNAWIIHYYCMFFLGVLACLTLLRRMPPAVLWTYVALLVVRLAWNWSLEIACATLAGITIYFAGQKGGLKRWLGGPLLQYFGRISYSLYLIHYPVSWIIVGIGYRLTGDAAWPALIWHILAIGLSIAAAHVLYTFVEAPSMALAQRLKPARAAAMETHVVMPVILPAELAHQAATQ